MLLAYPILLIGMILDNIDSKHVHCNTYHKNSPQLNKNYSIGDKELIVVEVVSYKAKSKFKGPLP